MYQPQKPQNSTNNSFASLPQLLVKFFFLSLLLALCPFLPKLVEVLVRLVLPLLTLLLLLLLLVGLVEVFTASSLQVLVVRLPLADVTQHRVRLLQLRELAVGLRLVRVSVGVLQLHLRQVRALDLGLTRVPTHTELEVVILPRDVVRVEQATWSTTVRCTEKVP